VTRPTTVVSRTGQLARSLPRRNHRCVERPIEHRDVTTIMALLGDIKNDVRRIRTLLEDDNGEEEEEDGEPDR
jgi:phage host-nuclease inhibitor protein Gam